MAVIGGTGRFSGATGVLGAQSVLSSSGPLNFVIASRSKLFAFREPIQLEALRNHD
jgi:hypothetical protein